MAKEVIEKQRQQRLWSCRDQLLEKVIVPFTSLFPVTGKGKDPAAHNISICSSSSMLHFVQEINTKTKPKVVLTEEQS